MTGASGGRASPEPESLHEVLMESRRLGFLGPGDVGPQIAHSQRFGAALWEGWSIDAPLVADLGAGGGVPSLPMALDRAGLTLVLVDASQKRTAFLVWASIELGLAGRVEVWCGRAEGFGHDEGRRFAFDGVVARGFGEPSMTLECAAPLLKRGGRCVISDPPEGRDWPRGGVAALGLRQRAGSEGFAMFERVGDVADAFPRSIRSMRRAPVFDL